MVKFKVSDVTHIITTVLELGYILKGGLSCYYIPSSEKTEEENMNSSWYSLFFGLPVFPASLLPPVLKSKVNWSYWLETP